MAKEKPTRGDIHNALETINRDLDEFIKHRIQDGILSDKDWSHLFSEPEKKWCWETLSCNKEGCPVRQQKDYRCWLVAGTMCGGKVQGDFAKKFGSCMNCEVYTQYHESPIRALYENISILISHLSDEVCEFRHEARTDELTKLLSRTSFKEVIKREVTRSRRMGGARLTLVEFDLDNFKEINDKCGHLAGDYYLVEFANVLRRQSRNTDFVFRIGGDEFIVLLVGGNEGDMFSYIERVQEGIADWNANILQPYHFALAASSGGACLNDFEYDIDKCYAKADERMYRNKQERKASHSRHDNSIKTGALRGGASRCTR